MSEETTIPETTETTAFTTTPPEVMDPVYPKKPLSQEDKLSFFKAYISDAPYTETITLFGGKYSYTFRTLQYAERVDMITQVTLDQESGKSKQNDEYFIRVQAYATALSLTAVNGTPFAPEITKDKYKTEEKKTYIAARAEILLNWADFKIADILDKHAAFDKKVILLMEAVNGENF